MRKIEGKIVKETYDYYGENFTDFYVEDVNDASKFEWFMDILNEFDNKKVRIIIEEIK